MKNQITRMVELDLLRFFAAFAVVLYHLTETTALWGAGAKYGYLGVNVFFMISGFVILWSADGRSAHQFAISRFARLYPCFWLCIGLTLMAMWLVGADLPSATQIAANMTMAAGLLDVQYINVVYWTLLIELKFYFLVGALLIFRQIKNAEYWLYAWLAASVADALMGVGPLRSIIIAPYGHLFIAGALFYYCRREGWTAPRIAALTICAALAVPFSAHQAVGMTKGDGALAPLLMLCAFALTTAISAGVVRIKSHPAIFTLAALTYPLYLLHDALGRMLIDEGVSVLIAILAALGISWAVDRIDRPVSRWVRSGLLSISGKFRGASTADARA